MLSVKDTLHAALWSLSLYVVDRLVQELRRVREEFQQLNQEARRQCNCLQQSLQLRLERGEAREASKRGHLPEDGAYAVKAAPVCVLSGGRHLRTGQGSAAASSSRPAVVQAQAKAAPSRRRRGQGPPPLNRAA